MEAGCVCALRLGGAGAFLMLAGALAALRTHNRRAGAAAHGASDDETDASEPDLSGRVSRRARRARRRLRSRRARIRRRTRFRHSSHIDEDEDQELEEEEAYLALVHSFERRVAYLRSTVTPFRNRQRRRELISKMIAQLFADAYHVGGPARFRSRFRCTFAGFVALHDELFTDGDYNRLPGHGGSAPYPPLLRLAIFLQRMGSMGHVQGIRSVFWASEGYVVQVRLHAARMRPACISGLFRAHLQATIDVRRRIRERLSRLIAWPTAAEQRASASEWSERWGFPSVMGALDGSYIKIPKPPARDGVPLAVRFFNRKGFHAVTLQVVCDHRYAVREQGRAVVVFAPARSAGA